MGKLYDYYGMKINMLCRAVMSSDEQLVDRLLADEKFTEINDGVSPLYFIGYMANGELDDAKREKILRVFRKILNNERFTNVNTVFYDGNYSSTLLYHLLFQEDPVFDTCCVDLINSPKYQLIDYPGNYGDNPTDLNTAVIKEKKQVVRAIMDHPDFTKIDFSFGGFNFVEECKKIYEWGFDLDDDINEALQLIMDEYVFRKYHDCYNATDTNIAKRLTDAIQTLSPYVMKSFSFSPMDAACNITRTNNNIIIEIVNHPKFTSEILSRYIKDIARRLSNQEAYELFNQNVKLEGWTPELYSNLAYFLINHGKTGLMKALFENEKVCFNEQFYSYYNYFLKNAIKASSRRNGVLDFGGYNEHDGNEICRIVDEKYINQLANNQLDPSKFVELTTEDYTILRNGMNFFYDLVSKNGNESMEPSEIDEELYHVLRYDDQNNKVGPFFNSFDRDKIWNLFNNYQSFDKYRQMLAFGATGVNMGKTYN